MVLSLFESKLIMSDMRNYSWPPTKGLRGPLTLALMKFSFVLRAHPMRFLFSNWILRWFDIDSADSETKFFRHKWRGSIWDVGASVGKYTVILARANPDCTIYAFEPNLNSLYYLGYRTARYPNVVIVPCALTADGAPSKTSYSADFLAPPTGPHAYSVSLQEAVARFGRPAFAKFDIEGDEYFVFEREPRVLVGAHLLIEWHHYKVSCSIPEFQNWHATDAATDDGVIVTKYYRPAGSAHANIWPG
ncbi:FkbM family methyltransferase [bacterium]|nr:FkbM family methyltransferase [bacterium]